MSQSDVEELIISFVRKYYERHGTAPSVRTIAKKVKAVTIAGIYKAFPGGLAEICQQARVPAPKQRIKATRRALKARKAESFEDIKLLEEKVERLAQIVAFLGGRVGGEQLIFEDEHWDELWERYENLRIEKK
jgi:hypothetical protein